MGKQKGIAPAIDTTLAANWENQVIQKTAVMHAYKGVVRTYIVGKVNTPEARPPPLKLIQTHKLIQTDILNQTDVLIQTEILSQTDIPHQTTCKGMGEPGKPLEVEIDL